MFFSIRTGQPYSSDIPRTVLVPLPDESLLDVSTDDALRQDDRLRVTTLEQLDYGDPGWEDALVYWMFIRGYARVEDIEREVAGSPPEPPDSP